MFWFIVLISPVVLFCIYTIESFKYWSKKNVYCETPIPIVGNFLKVTLRLEQMGEALRSIYERTGDKVPYFGVYIFHTPFFVPRSREMVKNVLIRDFSSFPNRTIYTNEKVDPYSTNFLFSLKNDLWRSLRKKLSPVFTSGKMKLMLPLIKEVTDQLEEVVKSADGQEVDVRDLSKRYAVDVISSCAFGINAESLKNENAKIKIMVSKLLDQRGFIRTFAVFLWLFCPKLVEILRLPFVDEESSKFLMKVFKESSEKRKKQTNKRHDLIDVLNGLKEEEEKTDLIKFDDATMSAQALVFFNAGAEGTSTVLSICLYELAVNPEIQMKVRDEIKKNLDPEGSISYEALFGMEYLDLVVKETLRKHPFVQFLQRYAENDHIFPDTGLKIEKGTQVLIPMLAIHYDPKYYPNPEKFDPERFRGDKLKNLQYVYLPFGDGPRGCIGQRFAMMSMKFALVMLLKTVEVAPGNKTDIPIKFTTAATFTTPKNGTVFLKIKKL